MTKTNKKQRDREDKTCFAWQSRQSLFTSMKHKKAQEEIFGFVILIVILVVVGLVFLTFYKPKQVETEKYIQTKIDNMLYSIANYDVSGSSIKGLAGQCYSGSQCDLLSSELSKILPIVLDKSSMAVGKQIKGYSFNITNTQISLSSGQLSGNMISSVAPLSSNADIEAVFSIYY